jgi:hypothetical protein
MTTIANYLKSLFAKKQILELSNSGRTLFIEFETEEQAEKALELITALSPEIESD